MSEPQTYTEYLADIILGKKPKPKCFGNMAQQYHEETEYTLIIGKYWFSFGCPKCGFGTGGSISEKDRDYLQSLTQNKSTGAKP
jgi:hypothetical protein